MNSSFKNLHFDPAKESKIILELLIIFNKLFNDFKIIENRLTISCNFDYSNRVI